MTKYAETHYIHQIVAIDLELRSESYPNSKKLKQICNVKSERTISRYINIMKIDYDAPIEFDYSKNGYYYTDKNFFIQNIILKEGELLTISAIIPLLEQYKNTPLESSFRSIMEKLIEFLPDKVSVDTSFLNGEIKFILEPFTKLADGIFDSVLMAAKQHKTLEFEYKTAQNTSYEMREFNPYHIISQKGSWYMIGYSFHSNEIRIYALPRMKNVRISQKTFTVPASFNIEQYIDPNMGFWSSNRETVKVELIFNKGLKAYVTEREWHKNQIMKENDDGSVYLSFETNQLGQTAGWIMEFCGAIQVLNPPQLIDEVQTAAKRILANKG